MHTTPLLQVLLLTAAIAAAGAAAAGQQAPPPRAPAADGFEARSDRTARGAGPPPPASSAHQAAAAADQAAVMAQQNTAQNTAWLAAGAADKAPSTTLLQDVLREGDEAVALRGQGHGGHYDEFQYYHNPHYQHHCLHAGSPCDSHGHCCQGLVCSGHVQRGNSYKHKGPGAVCVHPPPCPTTPPAQICAAGSSAANVTWTCWGRHYGSVCTGDCSDAATVTQSRAVCSAHSMWIVTPGACGTIVPLPAGASSFFRNARGFWFQAPSCFVITGLEVPTDAANGTQNIAVVRLDAPPPNSPAATNAFTQLFLTQNNAASGMIPVTIPVSAGEWIGVLGTRGADRSSYPVANAPTATTINGQPVALNRLIMPYWLSTTAPKDLSNENGAKIGRVFMYTAPCC